MKAKFHLKFRSCFTQEQKACLRNMPTADEVGKYPSMQGLYALVEDLQSFNHLTKPSILYEFRSKLPATAGVYFLYVDCDVFYVGQSIDIKKRWKDHHIDSKLALASEVIVDKSLRLGWIEVPRHLLSFTEIYLIGLLRPVLNLTHNS